MRRDPWKSEFLELGLKRAEAEGWTGPFVGKAIDAFPECMDYMKRYLAGMCEDIGRDSMGGMPGDDVMEMMKQHSPHELHAALTVANFEYQNVLSFQAAGSKVFHFLPGIVNRLAHTQLNAPSAFFRLPFNSILASFRGREIFEAVQMMAAGDVVPVTEQGVLHAYLHEVQSPIGRKILIMAHYHVGARHVAAYKRELLLKEGWDLEQVLRTDWETEPGAGEGDPFTDSSERFYTDGLALFRIIVNAMLYLSSNDADVIHSVSPVAAMQQRAESVQSPVKRRKILSKVKQFSANDGTIVGSNTPILIDKSMTEAHEAGDGTGSMRTRFLVRGHWRSQPHGPKNSLRRWIFIEPHWKGPDMAEAVNREYVVR